MSADPKTEPSDWRKSEREWGNRVSGKCPSCGTGPLFVAVGGHVTCSWVECSEPTIVADFLLGEFRSLEHVAYVDIDPCGDYSGWHDDGDPMDCTLPEGHDGDHRCAPHGVSWEPGTHPGEEEALTGA